MSCNTVYTYVFNYQVSPLNMSNAINYVTHVIDHNTIFILLIRILNNKIVNMTRIINTIITMISFVMIFVSCEL